jgi:hypothetical protein
VSAYFDDWPTIETVTFQEIVDTNSPTQRVAGESTEEKVHKMIDKLRTEFRFGGDWFFEVTGTIEAESERGFWFIRNAKYKAAREPKILATASAGIADRGGDFQTPRWLAAR